MRVVDELLEKTCKNMIQTILSCLDHATKGTIYRISSMPALQAVRITSGIRIKGTDDIQWGLPSSSDYNPPGKSWEQYRDRPGHVLEAMGWCVEKQKSWTADNPFEDIRSVGKQLRGEIEDFHHMEPVLVRKVDLYGSNPDWIDYPKDWQGNLIWQDTEYVVAAVIKIHFLPHTIKRDDRTTKIIRELSRSLGTELLSLQLRENLLIAQKELARQRLQSCEILAHELRNTLAKFGFIFSTVNTQIGILREEWEAQLRLASPEIEWKDEIVRRLNDLALQRMASLSNRSELMALCESLLAEQRELELRSFLPGQGEQWISNRIRPKWRRLLSETDAWSGREDEIASLLIRLEASLFLGKDERLISRAAHLPAGLREKWPRLVYTHFTADTVSLLPELLELLDYPDLPVPHRAQIAKALRSLKALVELVPEVEGRANRIILSLRNGSCTAETGSLEELGQLWSCHLTMPRGAEAFSLSD